MSATKCRWATADTNNHDHYLAQLEILAMDYHDAKGFPNWTSWDLITPNDFPGTVARQDSFTADTNLPTNFYKVSATAYSRAGYDCGQLIKSLKEIRHA